MPFSLFSGPNSRLSILQAVDALMKLMLEPTSNIAGFSSGYSGEGWKTVIPAKAIVRVDFRLVGNQDPDDIFRKVCRHVKHHTPGLQVKFVGAMKPSRTRPDISAVQRVIEAVELGFGIAPIVQPSLGGSLPDYGWTRTLGVPSVLVPYANADENNHAPNENLDVEKFYAGIKCTLSVLDVLGRMKREESIS